MQPKAKSRRRDLPSSLPERVLLAAGVTLTIILLACTLISAQAEKQAVLIGPCAVKGPRQTQIGDQSIVPEGAFGATYLNSDEADRPGQVIGRIRIPALDLVVPVISGITDADLLRGAGHIPGTGYAGGLGNMAVAAHRDTHFRALRRVAPGMVVLVSGLSGTYRYQVDRTEIVSPEQLRVLDIGQRPQLTMVTCYPFNFIGAAPSRFIVFAHLLSAAPDEKSTR